MPDQTGSNADDPLVLADADDYGTGWAGHMRVGHLTFVVGNDENDSYRSGGDDA